MNRLVALIGTGGTIARRWRADRVLEQEGRLGAEELAAAAREVLPDIQVLPIEFRSVPSGSVTPADWLELNRLIHHTVESNRRIDGVVVTHGTATLEETAYFLNLTLRVEVPVVIVGAMRPLESPGADALPNLLGAIRAAATPDCAGLGVLVLLDMEVHAARDVTKAGTQGVGAFSSPHLGMLGYADMDGVEIYRTPRRQRAPNVMVDVRNETSLPRVDIVYSYVGADGAAVDALVQNGSKGLVSCGLGSGYTTPDERRALTEARRSGIVVVQSSRTGCGRVLRPTRLEEDEIIVSDDLNAQKARVLTSLALTVSDDRATIQSLFREY